MSWDGFGLMTTRNSYQPGRVLPSAKNHVFAVPAGGTWAAAGEAAIAAGSKATAHASQTASADVLRVCPTFAIPVFSLSVPS